MKPERDLWLIALILSAIISVSLAISSILWTLYGP